MIRDTSFGGILALVILVIVIVLMILHSLNPLMGLLIAGLALARLL